MRLKFVAAFLMGSICAAQTPSVQTSQPNVPAPTPAAVPAGPIVVTQGTTVALTLVSSIRSKSTKVGDSVRAVVAFPLTVGRQLAIPAGTYVEGKVTAVNARPSHGRPASTQLHFTRLLYSNGYAVPLDAENTEAMAIFPETNAVDRYLIADAGAGAPFLGEGFAETGFVGAGQSSPQLPPLPQTGPSPGVVIGATLGGAAGLGVLFFALSHRAASNSDFLLFDNGWQFQMVLDSPLTLDAGKVAEAAAMTAGK